MSRKKPQSRSRPSSRSRSRRSSSSSVQRFLRAFALSAFAAFSVASCVLNPEWRDTATLETVLAELGWQSEQPAAVPVASGGPYAQTRFSQCRDFFPLAGTPIVPVSPGLRELCFSAFAVLHSGQTKTPVFVAQRLNRDMLLQGQGVQRTDRFYAEARLPSAERAELADYRNSGYSRGHMAPAADMHNDEAMAQSFSLANMVPQNQSHNAGAWSRIEQDTRKYVMRSRGDVYVFTGPVYMGRPATIGSGRVAVPTHLYKVVHDAASGRTWVHWQENSAASRAGPPISYEEFVSRTGLHLLPQPGQG